MTITRSQLLPVLRSETQARLLAALLLDPEREVILSDLAREIGADPGNVHGEVNRLVEAGILADRRVGRSRLIRDGRSGMSRPLAELLLPTYGPKPVLEEALCGIEGIHAAYIFGSWAARYTGTAGPQPHDIDVLIIGDADDDAVYEVARAASARLGHDVQFTRRSRAAWSRPPARDGFLRTVQASPHIPLDLTETPR